MKETDTINFKTFSNFEEVPYLNSDGDIIQDIVKEIEKQTEDLQNEFISQDNSNVVSIDFSKNNDNK
ncbi:MAG: hypothetical protein J6C50_00835 [Rickettsiales bacterium]|nr:hypothetical protein [Rickettsiales bacterium]